MQARGRRGPSGCHGSSPDGSSPIRFSGRAAEWRAGPKPRLADLPACLTAREIAAGRGAPRSLAL